MPGRTRSVSVAAILFRPAKRLAKRSQMGARLPREASPVSVDKDGYHDNEDDDPKPGRHSDPFVRSVPTLLGQRVRHTPTSSSIVLQPIWLRLGGLPCSGAEDGGLRLP
jgi:hypothetical protein